MLFCLGFYFFCFFLVLTLDGANLLYFTFGGKFYFILFFEFSIYLFFYFAGLAMFHVFFLQETANRGLNTLDTHYQIQMCSIAIFRQQER